MSLIQELRRRNVIRVAGLYLVGAWLMTQVAGTVLPMFGAPDWLPRSIVIVLAIGFVPALVFAWAFELTPQGIKRDAEVKRDESIAPQTGRRIDRMIMGILICALVYFGVDKFVVAPRRAAEQVAAAVQSAGQPAAQAGDKSIAVLPFDSLSDEKSNAYFAEGIQDEILTRLSKIGALRVISRTSTQQYASKPGNLSEIARQLGVANIVEGSVQKAGDAVRVNVQLIRAASDVHLWAEIYDRKLDNLFTVQSEVASAIAAQLQATLSGDEKKALAAPLTTNVQAHDAWLRAVAYFNRGGEDPQGDELAIRQLTEATRIDPGFAAAWALLSRSHGSQYFQQYDHSDARKAQAKNALDHAVQLAPDTTETRTAVGYYQYWVERDFPAAIRTFSAIEANEPNNIDALPALGYIARRQGRQEEALRRLDQAIELDPRNIQLLTEAAWTHMQAREFAGAMRVVDRALNVKPDDGNLIAAKTFIYQKLGRLDEAASLVDALRPDGSLPQVVIAINTQANLTRQFAPAAASLQAMLDQIAAAPAARVDPVTRGGYETIVGTLQLRAGDSDAGRKNLESARGRLDTELRNEPGNFIGHFYLSWALSELGDRDAALKTINRAIEQTPASADALYGPLLEDRRARIQAHFGETDAPIAALERLLKIAYANSITVAQMRLDPDWDALRGDARFQALLNSQGIGAAQP
ncbi:MAG TPA: tetratricopeptide repeat protein [Rudaea sp.]|jgi:TolB-like protein